MALGQLLFALTLSLFQALKVCLVRSDISSPSSLEDFSARLSLNLPASEAYQQRLGLDSGFDQLDKCDLVLDATMSLSTELYREANAVVLALTASGKSRTKNCLCWKDEEVYTDLTLLLGHFNWTSVSLLLSPDPFGMQMSAYLDANHQVAEELIISDTESSEHIRRALSTRIKQFGSNIIVVATSLISTKKVLSCLKEENMLRPGFVVIVVGEGVWRTEDWQGLLLVKEEECVGALSRSNDVAFGAAKWEAAIALLEY